MDSLNQVDLIYQILFKLAKKKMFRGIWNGNEVVDGLAKQAADHSDVDIQVYMRKNRKKIRIEKKAA